MKDINIKVIPKMRYPTCGDYWETDDSLEIRVLKQDCDDYEILVAIHELIEFYLTRKRGIPESTIMDYDLAWENRDDKVDEPGNQDDCPYKKEHRFSENVERLLAEELGVNWFKYEKDLKI